jgi:hypothetical protein
VSFGLTLFHWGHGQLEQALQGASELKELAAADDEGQGLAAHTLLSIAHWHLGANQAARAGLDRVVAIYRPERHAELFFTYLLDFGVFCRSIRRSPTPRRGLPTRRSGSPATPWRSPVS